MRLLLVTSQFPNPSQPTKGIYNHSLARELARQHELRVITPILWADEWRWNGDSALPSQRREIRDGIDIHYPRYYYPPKVLRQYYGWFYWQSMRSTALRVAGEQRPDAILTYWAHPDGEAAVRLGRKIGVPVVLMVGGSDVLLLTGNAARRARILNVLKSADAVVTVGGDLKEKMVALGVPAGHIHLVSRGVDSSIFSPGNRSEARRRLNLPVQGKILLWVGRMELVKGLDVLLAAYRRLLDGIGQQDCQTANSYQLPATSHSEHIHLYLIGDGSLRRSLESTCQAQGLSQKVTFVGAVPYERLADWYRAADYVVLPSRSEGVPNVLRECLACGTPFVASRVGGIPELAGEGMGNRLAPAEDAKALAEVLGEVIVAPSPVADAPGSPVSPSWAESAEALMRVVRPLVQERSAAGESPTQLRPRISWRRVALKVLSATMPRRQLLTRGPVTTNTVCLTFDDGPDPEHTPRVLDALRKQDVAATFFLIGQNVERYPDLVRRIVGEGHCVGHHSFTHSEPSRTSARQLLDEVQRTQDLLVKLMGKPSSLFRPPHGKATARKLWSLWRAGLTVVLWNVDTKDYACRSSAELRKWFEGKPLHGGDLVLFHDNRPYAGEVLPEVLARARKRGIRFATADQWVR